VTDTWVSWAAGQRTALIAAHGKGNKNKASVITQTKFMQ